MEILINWVIGSLLIFTLGYILPGVHVETFISALITALVIGVINAFLKPVLIILTLPINIITFGLFTLVINALLIQLAASLVPGFRVDSFWWALLFGVILSVLNSFFQNRIKS